MFDDGLEALRVHSNIIPSYEPLRIVNGSFDLYASWQLRAFRSISRFSTAFFSNLLLVPIVVTVIPATSDKKKIPFDGGIAIEKVTSRSYPKLERTFAIRE